MSKHFGKQDAAAHVIEKRVEGVLSLSEGHGMEMPGFVSAAADAARESAIVLLLAWIFVPPGTALLAIGLAWMTWKTGRSAWLGWSRLERLHRVIEQEKYEVEHHRPQEREELIALYSAKGFEGKLLGDVVDVLMADQDRLLKVMLEEEMGLTLQAYEHPLKQALGAALGSFLALILCSPFFLFFPSFGMLFASAILLLASATLSALFEKNRVIAAVIWNLSIGALAFGVAYFIFQML